jgi:hypothetical protein
MSSKKKVEKAIGSMDSMAERLHRYSFPTDSIDSNLRKFSRDVFLIIVSVFGSLSGFVQGFTITLSGMHFQIILLLLDDSEI